MNSRSSSIKRVIFISTVFAVAISVLVGLLLVARNATPLTSATSLHEITRAAEEGAVEAQRILGLRYGNGDGVEKDYAIAVSWYRKAAEAGDAIAQNQLGYAYEKGQGVEQDLDRALYWYRQSAKQKYPLAIANVGRFYDIGIGVPRDTTEAAKWYLEAAELGHDGAQTNIALLYHEGEGVSKYQSEALRWMRQAANSGNATASMNLGNWYFQGAGVEKDYIKAGQWYRKSKLLGSKQASEYIDDQAAFCEDGSDDRDNDVKEIACLLSAGAGVRSGEFAAGTYYDAGNFVDQDFEAATFWFRKASEHGHPFAQAMLGKALAEGRGTPRNDPEAFGWFSLLEKYTPNNEKERFAVDGAKKMKKLLWNRMDQQQKVRAEELSKDIQSKYSTNFKEKEEDDDTGI